MESGCEKSIGDRKHSELWGISGVPYDYPGQKLWADMGLNDQQSPDPGRLWYLIKVFLPQTESFGRGMAWSSMHFRSMSQVALWSMNWRGKLHCFWLHPPSVNQDQLSSIVYERFTQPLFLKRTMTHYHERCGEVVSGAQKKSLPPHSNSGLSMAQLKGMVNSLLPTILEPLCFPPFRLSCQGEAGFLLSKNQSLTKLV